MFDLNAFIMKMLKGSVGNELDYKVRENTLGYLNKHVITQADAGEIEAMLVARQEQLEAQRVAEEQAKAEADKQMMEQPFEIPAEQPAGIGNYPMK